MSVPRILVIAGSDSSGGAGIQADIKTVMAFGGYAMTAITALTAQNTQTVSAIHPVPTDFIREQITLALDDIGADVVKTGMLYAKETVELVADILAQHPQLKLVLDPVMVSTSGKRLLEEKAVETVKQKLIPRATLVTPNMPEAALLTGLEVKDVHGMIAAGKAILAMGAHAVLVKGGHDLDQIIKDVLVTTQGEEVHESIRIDSRHTHGTGCTLASAIACQLAGHVPLKEAVTSARAYVAKAIRKAPGLGKGHGPLNHRVKVTGD